MSPLCQIDGNDSPPPTPSHNQVFSLPPVHPTQTTSDHGSGLGASNRVRTVSYSLDRAKQITRLGHDATTEDFTIVISKNKENVNIDCNVGFYTTVAVPAIQHLAASQVFVCQGVSVHCQDVVGTFDATQAQQNTVIFFRLSKNKSSLGCVRIHLHHTTRKVQLQGGALLAGEQKAPVWFVENVLRNNFAKLSQEKAAAILNLNQAVSKSLTLDKNPSVCAGCDGQFNGRSNPAFCKQCKSFFHKFKCFHTARHQCYPNKSSKSVVTVPAQPTSVPGDGDARPAHLALQVPHQHEQQTGTEIQGTTFDYRRTVTTSALQTAVTGLTQQSLQLSFPDPALSPTQSPVEVHTQPADQLLHPPGVVPQLPLLPPRPAPATEEDQSVLAIGSLVNIVDVDGSDIPASNPEVQPRLNPNAPPFSLANPNAQPTGAKKKNKKKDNTIPTDHDGIQLEFTKMEVSTLQARLQKQELDLKALKFRNEILMERNKSLEEAKKKEIHDQYFPSHPPNHTQTQSRQHTQPCSYQPCSGHQTCHTSCYPHTHCWPPGCMNQKANNDTVVTGSDSNTHSDINRVVVDLKSTSESLHTTLDRLLHYLSSITPSPTITEDNNHPSPNRHREATELPSQDMSSVSLDGFMFTDDGSERDLN